MEDRMKDKLPKCIGYVDGSLIKLDEAPSVDHESYYTRKQFYAIQLQATCDNNCRIRNLFVGYPGSVHDARVFSNSEIGRHPEKFFSEGQYIGGDSAYAISENLVAPFKRNSTTANASDRAAFNTYFSSYRVKIECVYGILKETFASLKSLRVRVNGAEGHELACKWITACCILFNILRESFDDHDFDHMVPEDEEDEMQLPANVRENEKTRVALFHFVIGKLLLQ